MDGLGDLPSLGKKSKSSLASKPIRDVGDGVLFSAKPNNAQPKGRDEIGRTVDLPSTPKRRTSTPGEMPTHSGPSAIAPHANSGLTSASSIASTPVVIKKLQDTRSVFPVLSLRGPVAGRWAPRDDDNASIIRSLLEMVSFRGGASRIRALNQIRDMITGNPKQGARACEDMIDLKGVPIVVALLKSQELSVQCLSAKILQLVAQSGYHKHILELPASLPAVKHLLQVDSQEANAAGASLVAALKPAASFFETLPLLARILNFKSLNARIDAASAMHGLVTTPELSYDLKEYQDGKLIEQVLHHLHGNPSERVRELCASIIATLAALSSRHRIKILRNDGLRVLMEQLTDTCAAIVSNCMTAIMNMALEERALKLLIHEKLDEKIAIISGALDGTKYHTKLRDQAAQALNRFNTLAKAEQAKILPIRELTSDQDLHGLSLLFTLLPTIFVCRTICRVSTAWRAAAMKPTTWKNLELCQCSFLTDQRLMSFLSNVPLSNTRYLTLSKCKGLHSGIFEHLAKTLTAKLFTLDFSYCDRVKDNAVMTIFKTSQEEIRKVNLSGCLALSNKIIFAMTVHLVSSLVELALDSCSWLHDDAMMLLAGQCRRLSKLGISACLGLTPEGIKALHYSRSLRDIDISLNPAVTDNALIHIAQSMTLTEINIAGCENVTMSGASTLKMFTSLNSLDCSGNTALPDDSLIEITRHCPRLTSLRCMMVPSITDDSMRSISNHCKNLCVLDLGYCPLISDIGLRGVVRSCLLLRDLNLAWCEMLTPKGIRSISDNCKLLEKLNLSQCAVNDIELMSFSQCTRLERMILVGCNGITVSGIDAFIQDAASQSLKMLDVRETVQDPSALRAHPDHIKILAGSMSSLSMLMSDVSPDVDKYLESPSLSAASSPRTSPRRGMHRRPSRSMPSSHLSFSSSPVNLLLKATAALKHFKTNSTPQGSET